MKYEPRKATEPSAFRLFVAFAALLVMAAALIFVPPIFTKDGSVSGCSARTVDIFVHSTAKVCLTRFRMDCGRYPTTAEGIKALVVCPVGLEEQWKGPYLDVKNIEDLKDPWGRKYLYTSPGIKNRDYYDFWSFGVDLDSDRDDIRNWN
jgi:general secretion pathway protein G